MFCTFLDARGCVGRDDFGHYGLTSEIDTYFTSFIRRYVSTFFFSALIWNKSFYKDVLAQYPLEAR